MSENRQMHVHHLHVNRGDIKSMENLPDIESDKDFSSQINKFQANIRQFLLIGCDKSETLKFLERFILSEPFSRNARTRLVRLVVCVGVRFPGDRQVASCCIVNVQARAHNFYY